MYSIQKSICITCLYINILAYVEIAQEQQGYHASKKKTKTKPAFPKWKLIPNVPCNLFSSKLYEAITGSNISNQQHRGFTWKVIHSLTTKS